MLRPSDPASGCVRGAALVLLAALLLAAGCTSTDKSGKSPVFVVGIDDRASGSPRGLLFDQETARRYLSAALARSRTLVEVEEDAPGAFHAELTIGLASERRSDVADEEGTYRAVQVELTIRRHGQDEAERVSASGSAFLVQGPKVEQQTGFDRVLDKAMLQAVENLDLQIETRSSPLSELRAKLKSKRAEDRLYVLRTLRERKAPELVPDVIGMLNDDDDDVILEAVGVLVAQKDRRAVLPLIRMSQTRDPVFQLQLITAVAELGGDVARGYLFTLAAGHRSSEIRKRAAEGLDRIREQEAEAKADPAAGTAVALPQQNEHDSAIHK